jgi:hypothetical protein
LSIETDDPCSYVGLSFRGGISEDVLEKLSSLATKNEWQILDGQTMDIIDLKDQELSLAKWLEFRDKIADGGGDPLDGNE